ncbi:hypothetical protein ABB55_14235 [Prosthecomicrobium hirschii]|uniref:Uncharacterized protein n=1 Tax=Prosthecodimorpha hirschii TaxID=665126 RepID=A0A0P6W786_9HYPH|nr:hypothetical protein ABB55_14235 [Prosthecomicrobium hirschii]
MRMDGTISILGTHFERLIIYPKMIGFDSLSPIMLASKYSGDSQNSITKGLKKKSRMACMGKRYE